MRSLKIISVLLAVAILFSCAAPPAIAPDAPPAAGMGRLVLYYPAYAFSDPALLFRKDKLDIGVASAHDCLLESGSYLVRDVAAGKQIIAISRCGALSTSRGAVYVTAGQTYYIRIMPYDSSITGIISGYPSEVVEPDAKPHTGPVEIKNMDAATALADIQSLKRVTGN
jgi:hypothetical protein